MNIEFQHLDIENTNMYAKGINLMLWKKTNEIL